MAMNKAERAEMERLQAAATPLFPTYQKPKPLTDAEIAVLPTVDVKSKYGTGMTKVTAVWFVNVAVAKDGHFERAVRQGSVTANGVNRSNVADTDSRRQNDEIMFITREDGLHYIRFEIASAFAKSLKKLDDYIGGIKS